MAAFDPDAYLQPEEPAPVAATVAAQAEPAQAEVQSDFNPDAYLQEPVETPDQRAATLAQQPEGYDLPLEEQRELGVTLAQGGIPGSRDALAGFLTTLSPQARIDMVKEHIPGANIVQEGETTFIDLPISGSGGRTIRTVVNKPGLSGQDVQDFAGLAMQFLPAEKFAMGGKTLLARMGRAFGGSAATETARQVASQPAGSEQDIDVGEIVATGAAGTIGQGIGEAIPAAGRVVYNKAKDAYEGIKPYLGKESSTIAKDVIGEVLTPEAAKNLRAAQKLGADLGEDFVITPAEATGSVKLAKIQGKTGVTDSAEEILSGFQTDRKQVEKALINKFLDNLSPDSSSASRQVKLAADNMFGGLDSTKATIAAPFYQSSHTVQLADNVVDGLAQDPVIANAIQAVEGSPIWTKELRNVSRNSVRYFDIVKQSIDDDITRMLNQGRNNQARIALDTKDALLNVLDNASPEYQTGRAIYSVFSNRVDELADTPIGQISRLSDVNLKKVSKLVFDPGQTDKAVRDRLFSDLTQSDPNAVRQIMRNEIERRLDTLKGNTSGTSFFNTVLSKDRDFKMFLDAAKDMPDVKRNLIYMRRTFKNLINRDTVAGTAGKAKSSLDVPRSSVEALTNYLKEAAGGNYDKAAAELITNPRWADAIKEISVIKNQEKQIATLLPMLAKISLNQSTIEEE